jgi:hypothetical protein
MEYACHGSLQNSPQSCIRARPKACEAAFWKFWARVSGAARHVSTTSIPVCIIPALAHTNIYMCVFFLPRGIMQQHITGCLGHAEERISWLLALEDRPFTMNHHYLSDYRNKFLAHYKSARELQVQPDIMKTIQSFSSSSAARGFPLNAYNGQLTGVAKVMSGLAEIGVNGVKPEDLAKLLQPDNMEPALAIMADVRAYFQGMVHFSVVVVFYVIF